MHQQQKLNHSPLAGESSAISSSS